MRNIVFQLTSGRAQFSPVELRRYDKIIPR